MPLSGDALDALFGTMVAAGAKYSELKAATQGRKVNLSPEMAAIIGQPTRRLVPILAVAVDAVADKLFMKSVMTPKTTATKQLTAWLSGANWDRLERDLYATVVRDGLAFVLTTWHDGAPVLQLKEAFDGVSGAYVVRSELTGEALAAVHTWLVSGDRYLDMYYADHIEKYVHRGRSKRWEQRLDTPVEQWPTDWTDTEGNPLGIALISFGDGKSVIAPALQLQDDVNAALLDLMAISRGQGWPQRYITSKDPIDVVMGPNGQPLRNTSGGVLRRDIRLVPGSVLPIPNGDLRQLESAGVDVSYVRELVSLISLETGVPQHAFTGSWPSGIALTMSETRLNTKVEAQQGVIGASIVTMLRLVLRMASTFGGPRLDTLLSISVEWYPPQIESQELITARDETTRELYEKGLLSLRVAVQRLHHDWSKEQVDAEVAQISTERGIALS